MAPLTISKVSTASGVCGDIHTLSTSLFTTAAAASDAMPLVSMSCMGEGMGRRKVMSKPLLILCDLHVQLCVCAFMIELMDESHTMNMDVKSLHVVFV